MSKRGALFVFSIEEGGSRGGQVVRNFLGGSSIFDTSGHWMNPRSTESDMHIQLFTQQRTDSIDEQAPRIAIPVIAGSTESNIRKQLSTYIEFAKLATKMLQCQRGKRRRRAGMGAIGN